DLVWEDLNGNGLQSVGEHPIKGVEVTLNGVSGDGVNVALKTTTDASGRYYFSHLRPGHYSVSFSPPAGYFFTVSNQGDDDFDSDVIDGKINDISIKSGDLLLHLDAGLVRKISALGDFVWEDLNANGIQDAGEVGVPAVKVLLQEIRRDSILEVGHRLTDTKGYYLFDSLRPANYKLLFELPNGFSMSPNAKGSNPSLDSDPINGMIANIQLGTGVRDSSYDAGIFRKGRIGDFVWVDLNANGIQEINEPGLANVEIRLTGTKTDGISVSQTITTDSFGKYAFLDVSPGIYHIKVVLPGGYKFTSSDIGSNDDLDSDGLDGSVQNIAIISGQETLNIDIGVFRQGQIGDLTWIDLNGNGVQDAAEPGLEGIGILLSGYNGWGLPVSQTVQSDVNGKYTFASLDPGIYQVTFQTNGDYTFSHPNQGSDDLLDSDAISGSVTNIVIQSGEEIHHVDAGYYRFSIIGDRVWEDYNANGIQDPGDTGITNVSVQIAGVDGIGMPYFDKINTDSNGRYRFDSIPPGLYHMTFYRLQGYQWTAANQGNDDALDSDAIDGEIHQILVKSGTEIVDLDAGLYRYGTLGDFVWADSNGNGLQEANELGIVGVKVLLKGVDGTGYAILDSTLTNNAGKYIFDQVIPGTYTIKAGKPDGLFYSPSDQANDDERDSDGSNGMVNDISVRSGSTNFSYDFGLMKPISIGDFVWDDTNANGIQDPNELGIDGISIIISGAAVNGSNISLATTTADGGSYHFSSLLPGSYT
ncbi:MAG: SdrD B-like domain-containing protein, partial [Saprospiraceae bacterium]